MYTFLESVGMDPNGAILVLRVRSNPEDAHRHSLPRRLLVLGVVAYAFELPPFNVDARVGGESLECTEGSTCVDDPTSTCTNTTATTCQCIGCPLPNPPPSDPPLGTLRVRVYDENGQPAKAGTCLVLQGDPEPAGKMAIRDGVCEGTSKGGFSRVQAYVCDPVPTTCPLWGGVVYSIPAGDHVDLPAIRRTNAYFATPPREVGDNIVASVTIPQDGPPVHLECEAASASITLSDEAPGGHGSVELSCPTPRDGASVLVRLLAAFDPHAETVDAELTQT